MKVKTFVIFCLSLSVALQLCSCSPHDDDGLELKRLKVAVSASDTITSISDPVLLTVIVENIGNTRVVWGYGSSSCQLDAVIRIGEEDHYAGCVRICTDDIAELGLDPGDSRKETWDWDGQVCGKQGLESLPPGMYDVYGVAGAWKSRNAVKIEVVQQQ